MAVKKSNDELVKELNIPGVENSKQFREYFGLARSLFGTSKGERSYLANIALDGMKMALLMEKQNELLEKQNEMLSKLVECHNELIEPEPEKEEKKLLTKAEMQEKNKK